MEKKKRDLVEEIKSVVSRSEFNSRYDYMVTLKEIEATLKQLIEQGIKFDELLKYIPIATVACFEAFFRSTITELVDFGKPYNENVAKFNQAKNVKLDFEVVAAIQTKTLTIGEFIAHILPYNNLEDINSNLSIIMGKDFIGELKEHKIDPFFWGESKVVNDFRARTGEIINSVKRTFHLRHIFCHEFATNIKISQEEIYNNYFNCKVFLECCDSFVGASLYPNPGRTQGEMNAKAAEQQVKKEKELEELIIKIKVSPKIDYRWEMFEEVLFDKCLDKWKEYRTLHAEYKASYAKGGSIYPTLYASDMAWITQEKIRSLEEEFKRPIKALNQI